MAAKSQEVPRDHPGLQDHQGERERPETRDFRYQEEVGKYSSPK